MDWDFVNAMSGVVGVFVAVASLSVTYLVWRRGEGRETIKQDELTAVRNELAQKSKRLADIKTALTDENFWAKAPEYPPNYLNGMRSTIPILLVANLKGGVGKTTISANLAAHFAKKRGENVLAIDLDYQGSLSSLLMDENHREEVSSDANEIIAGEDSNRHLIRLAKSVNSQAPSIQLISAFYDFANFENRMMLEWVIGECQNDIRYNLAKFLLSEEVQRKYHRVIIDAPPRITTGFINALCASTHLITTFVLDNLSAEAVGTFLKQVKDMRPMLYPHLELAGVIGTMKRTKSALNDPQNRDEAALKAVATVKRRVREVWGREDYFLETAIIPRLAEVAKIAGEGVAYLECSDVRTYFDVLGEQVWERTKRYEDQRAA